MVRYKRYRRFKRRSTNTIMMKFQSFMDISTNANSMQIITVSAGGPELLRRLAPQFSAYKYFMMGNIAVKLVPASTLPVDPTGLSISVGDNLVDPRDQLTPGMMRITNGEDIFEDITGLTDDEQHGIYNNMLLDPRWFKWMLQSGVKRHATPRYWQIGQLHQDKWPGAIVNYPDMSSIGPAGTFSKFTSGESGTSNLNISLQSGSNSHGFFQVGHRGKLGWMPTDSLQPIVNNAGAVNEYPLLTSPVEVECMKLILPKAYKTRYWYRMFITETVYFREPIVNYGVLAADGNSYRPLDIFRQSGVPIPQLPTQPSSPSGYPSDPATGGNYGNN